MPLPEDVVADDPRYASEHPSHHNQIHAAINDLEALAGTLSDVETTTGSQGKVDTHALDTTAVHGIADTSQLAYQTTLTRAMPTTVGNYVEIGSYSITNGTHDLEVSVTVADVGFGTSKSYSLHTIYNQNAGVRFDIDPIATSGAYNGNDWALEAASVNTDITLRLRRTLGTIAGTATISLVNRGKTTDVFTALTGTGASAINPKLRNATDSIVVREYPGVDPRHPDFGADPTGVADSAAAINAAIEACFDGVPVTSVRNAKKPLYIGPGDYKILSAIEIRNCNYFTFRGAGTSTKIMPAANMDNAILFDGVNRLTIEDFHVLGFGNATAYTVRDVIGIEWQTHSPAYRSTSGIYAKNVHIQEVKNVIGLSLGYRSPGGLQVSETEWHQCLFRGPYEGSEATYATNGQCGIMIGDGTSGNNLNHGFYNCDIVGWKTGACVNAVTNVGFYVVDVGSNQTDFTASGSTFITFDTIRSEESERFLTNIFRDSPLFSPQDGASLIGGYYVHAALRNIQIRTGQLASDKFVIVWGHRGSMVLENVRFEDIAGDGSKQALIKAQPNGEGQSIVFNGCGAQGDHTPASIITKAGGADGPQRTSVTSNGWVRYDVAGTPQESYGIYTDKPIKPAATTTALRTTAASAGIGALAYDTTLGHPIYSDGTNWKRFTDNTVV